MKLNDNIVKSAVKFLIESLEELKLLEELDISDSLIGAKNSLKLFEALKVPDEFQLFFYIFFENIFLLSNNIVFFYTSKIVK